MKIKTVHAHFLISIGNYSNERIGFSVELDEGDDIEQVVESLRQKATVLVGKSAQEYYDERYKLKTECITLQCRLEELQKEWNRTADFLRAKGVNPEAPKLSLTPISRLLAASKIEGESVAEGEIEDPIY